MMVSSEMDGYLGRVVRVDLSNGKITPEVVDQAALRRSMGGTSLGIQFLYDEVSLGVEWKDSENRLFIGSGPLGGTSIEGSGTIAVVTKGPLTNGIASSQANGFFGTYSGPLVLMRSSYGVLLTERRIFTFTTAWLN